MIDAETIPFVDVTAVRMLDELAETLADAGVTLAIAHGVGQGRDLLHPRDESAGLQVFATVRDAVAALA